MATITSQAQLQYICNKYAKFQFNVLIIVRGSDYTKYALYLAIHMST